MLWDLSIISQNKEEEKPALSNPPKPKQIDKTKPFSATSSTFFADPAEVDPKPVEVAPKPKKSKTTTTKRKPATKRKKTKIKRKWENEK